LSEWVSLNGMLMPAADARVSVFDSGFLQGVGLFETMRTYERDIFRFDQHLERLRQSAEKLGWTVVPDLEQMRVNVDQVVRATPGDALRVRLTVTTGSLRDAAGDVPQLTYVATASPAADYPPEYYERGVTVALSPYRVSTRDPIARHKTTSYFSRLAALREAHAAGAVESIWFTQENMLAEGSISNVFLVRNGTLHTPSLDAPILPGITRGAIIDVAARLGLPLREEELTIDDLLSADEMFLTNTLMQVMPVVRIGQEPIGSERPGELTPRIRQGYLLLVKEECGLE
jgi:branched-chain amino acid aminotransferase